MINLFVNYYDSDDAERKSELEYCLKMNRENEYIDNIFIIGRNRRVRLSEFFQAMKKYPTDINIIANTDIYFDDTINRAKNMVQNEVYALTRWEKVGERIVSFNERHGRRIPAMWSQDAWIFRGSIDPQNFHDVTAVRKSTNRREVIPFTLGIPGCDNKLAAMLNERGYFVRNPSLSIKAIHVHRNDNRVYPDYMILHGIRPNGLVPQEAL